MNNKQREQIAELIEEDNFAFHYSNVRPAIKAMMEENEEMKENFLMDSKTIGSQLNIRRMISDKNQALEQENKLLREALEKSLKEMKSTKIWGIGSISHEDHEKFDKAFKSIEQALGASHE